MTSTTEHLNAPLFEQQEALTRQLYERKCSSPYHEDILNGLYELDTSLEHHPLAYRICRFWHSDADLGESFREWFDSDAEIGAFIRAWFKKDFLEVAEIEAEEEMARRVPLSDQVNDAGSEPEDMGAAT